MYMPKQEGVDEAKSFGCMAYVSIPSNDGKLPGQAYIRLANEEFVKTGVMVPFIPAT